MGTNTIKIEVKQEYIVVCKGLRYIRRTLTYSNGSVAIEYGYTDWTGDIMYPPVGGVVVIIDGINHNVSITSIKELFDKLLRHCPHCYSQNVQYAEAGAPGRGGCWYCDDCHKRFDSTIRVPEDEPYDATEGGTVDPYKYDSVHGQDVNK